MKRFANFRFLVLAAIVIGAAFFRLVPHPYNFTPIAALALFGGAHFARKSLAFALPLAAMLVSDIVFELLFGWGIHSGMPVVYGTFAVIAGIGIVLRNYRRSAVAVGAAAISSATLFFLVTNFFVWLGSVTYSQSLPGLAACYVAGLPFYGNQLMGDLFYSAILFGGFAYAERNVPALAPEQA